MTGLAAFEPITTEIPLPGGSTFTVRGLGIEDFGILIEAHLEAITRAAELYGESKKDIFTSASLQGFFLTMVRDAPTLVSEVISIAADEPDAKGKKVPLAVQVAALSEIARLTTIDAGGLGNLLAVLASALKGVLGDRAPGSLKQALSHATIGDSVKT